MKNIIKQSLIDFGDYSDVIEIKSVSGGDINDSFYIQTNENEYFIKLNEQSPERFFELEAEGLQNIKRTNTINVPEVYSYSDKPNESHMLLEWIEQGQSSQEDILGEKVAMLHKFYSSKHGYEHFTYIGTLEQPNGLYANWPEYYSSCRLKAQYDIGVARGSIKGKRQSQLWDVIVRCEELLPKNVTASYLHGDLWSGNWLYNKEGVPYLVDPSFLYGERHFELAFTYLFGGFSEAFYEGYKNIGVIEDYFDDVKPLYQLYYLLVHLNIFGEMYGSSVDSVLNHYSKVK
ncbi:fructosamine kinase family protein [Alkalibacillus haloalkaliphilus]|uniref:fructosamine kinase family protein n=1 Tax=Alkalibacillus haloalkaliphilus TaxID=94136 RepID=UPI002935DB98|nr:fructosamine kinase family protein [Alkalibacillus haloalkaliphilus]MDV2581146.1 fructosamine kinase family protein [Alkalibacillus haloalkaliphilus]